MFLVCAQILTHITRINENEAHPSLIPNSIEELSGCFHVNMINLVIGELTNLSVFIKGGQN